MGTTYSVTIGGFKDQEGNFKSQIDSLLSVTNKHFSTYLDDSEISNINTQESNSFTLSDEFLYVLKKALYYCEISDGHYDVTIAPLIDLWGFGRSRKMQIPEQKSIEYALSNVGYEKIVLTNNILLNNSKVKIDLNSIAKGYAVDKISEYIKELC